jgi:hypothetical protein
VGALLAGSEVSRPRDRVDRDTWERAVGERIAARTEPLTLQKGVLGVRVTSSVWAQELSLLGPTIVARLRASGRMVSTLRFFVGEVTPPVGSAARRVEPKRTRPIPEALRLRLAAIEDEELRRAIEEAAMHSLTDE